MQTHNYLQCIIIVKVDLYSSDLCATRWTLAYYRSNHRVMADPNLDFDDSSLNISEAHTKTKPILSQHDKYRKAFHVAQKLSTVVSESPMREFKEKLAVLEKLLELWEQGNEVIVTSVSKWISQVNMIKRLYNYSH